MGPDPALDEEFHNMRGSAGRLARVCGLRARRAGSGGGCGRDCGGPIALLAGSEPFEQMPHFFFLGA
jgi:hypothetical protein